MHTWPAGDWGDGAFPLAFGQVLHQQVAGALQLRVAIDLSAFPEPLPLTKFAHFEE